MPKLREIVPFDGAEEDHQFLEQQAAALGCDSATYIRMTIRQMRLGQLPTLNFGHRAAPVAQNPSTNTMPPSVAFQPAPRVLAEIAPEQYGAPSPIPPQNEPAEEFRFPAASEIPQSPALQQAPIQDAVSLVDEMIAAGQRQPPQPSGYRDHRRAMMASAAPAGGPPGSRTRPAGVNQDALSVVQGGGARNVVAQNSRHFFGR